MKGVIIMFENLKKISVPGEVKPISINFVGETVCDEKFLIERECSDLMSFEYIVDGRGILEIENQVLRPQKGDVFFLKEGTSHKYYSQSENGWHKYFISFRGPVADALVENYLPKDTYLFKNCFLEKNFVRIFDIAFNTEDIQTVENLLSIEIFKLFCSIRERSVDQQEDFADKIKRNIDNHLDEEFNLDVLCTYMNYTKNHLINMFSRKFGKTPYQYYIEAKVNLSKDYLLNTNMSIAEIANALGYSDQQYYSYCFKRETGFSPRQFRKNAKM